MSNYQRGKVLVLKIICIIPIFLFGCWGCSGSEVRPVRNYEKCPFEGGTIKKVEVWNDRPWQESSVIVDTGDELFFEAEGRWYLGPGADYGCSPAGRVGIFNPLVVEPLMLPEAPGGALIGKTGGSRPFQIGVQGYTKVTTPGVLYLAMNECLSWYGDNKPVTSIKVTIRHKKASLPKVSSSTITADKVVLNSDVEHIVNWRSSSKTSVVCVGISDYEHAGIPSITNATNDAQVFAGFAKQAGIAEENITMLIDKDATRSKIIGAINRLKMSTTEKSETAVLYFSGHGAPLIKNGKIFAGVIVPYDASEQSLEDTGIKLDWIEEKLGDLPGNSIIILDACFSGKEGRSLMAKNVKAIRLAPTPKTLIEHNTKNSWWLIATSGDNFANDLPKESHGLFTFYLLKALSGERGVDTNEDGLITIQEAFAWTKDRVTNVSAKSMGRLQVPELIGRGDTVLTIPR